MQTKNYIIIEDATCANFAQVADDENHKSKKKVFEKTLSSCFSSRGMLRYFLRGHGGIGRRARFRF